MVKKQRLENKECEQCGEVFSPKRKTQKFCCEKCQIASRYKDYNCVVCGTHFRSKHPNRKYCSNKCSAKVNIKPDLVHGLKCVNCKKVFSRPRHRIRASKVGQFCSRECWDEYNSAMKAEQSHKWRSKLCTCMYCGETFLRQNNQLKSREKTFCSHICYSHWMEENQYGEYSPSWRGGRITFRGFGWEKISEYIRQRDSYKCQECGKPQREQKLDVHHIIPYRFFENPNKANHEDNLISLCRSCHGKQESHWWKEVPDRYKQYTQTP